MQYTFDKLDKESLLKLYSEFGFRCKEIGSMVGISEDAVLKKLKLYEIQTNLRGTERKIVDVLFIGKKKDKKNFLTDDELLRMCKDGITDAAIGEMYNMTGEGIAYRRKKLGIDLSMKFNETQNKINKLKETPIEILTNDYYNLTQEDFSNKYSLSKATWRPHLKSVGIKGKEIARVESYPPLNKRQRAIIIGSLLGDGGIADDLRFYESHSLKQKDYLNKKYDILKPYSSSKVPCDDGTGIRMTTVCHRNFLEFRNKFYKEGIDGKLIPMDIIRSEWNDEILAIWFFDDGYYDDENNTFSIANKCPFKQQLDFFVDFLEERYGWSFRIEVSAKIYNVVFSKEYYNDFVNILFKYITPDLYYKIPEKYLIKEMVSKVSFELDSSIKPKFYRLSDDITKHMMEKRVFDIFRKQGFPYIKHTEDRLNYLVGSYKNSVVKEDNHIISFNNSGMSLCEYFFPNIYDCCRKGYKPPSELWNDDNFLMELIKNRLKYANRLTDSSIRTGLKLSKATVTNFKPSIATFIYKNYCKNGKIYDYSSGFGSRMLAAMCLDLEYVGCEPNLKSYENLNKFGNFLKKRTKGSFSVSSLGSENFLFEKNYFSLAFSSPPYFDYEKYSDDSGQSIIKFPVYENWLINYWRTTIENCSAMLTTNGFFGFCISRHSHEDLIKSSIQFCEECGLYFYEYYLVPFKHVFSDNKKYEIVIMFAKDPLQKKDAPLDKIFSSIEISESKKDSGGFIVDEEKIIKNTYGHVDFKAIEEKMKIVSKNKGVSRDTYKDPSLLGYPSHMIEHHYKGWNSFLRACGLEPQYEAVSPIEHVKEYLSTCFSMNKIFSFYEYECKTKRPATRLKRLFNDGKPYHHLLDELKSVALQPDLWPVFLEKFK